MQWFKTYWLTVLLGIVSLALTAASMGMLVVMALGTWLTIWFISTLWKLQKKKAHGAPFLIKSAIWLGVLVGIFAIQTRFANEIRHKADIVAALVVAYKQAHGAYPVSLDVLPVTTPNLLQESHLRYTLSTDGHPMLYYVSTTRLFTNYLYQFDKGTWRTISD